MKFLVINFPFPHWKEHIIKCDKCLCIDEKDIINYNNQDYKIIPLFINDYIKFNHLDNNIFKNSIDSVQILNNKSKFGKYMLNKYAQHIPKIYYYNFDNEIYVNNQPISNKKLIVKPNEMFGGRDIILINHVKRIKNSIVQEYIKHDKYFVGHFLVLNGVIIYSVYFSSQHRYPDGIKRGQILNYEIKEKINLDDSIFSKIFNDLNYSGFADSDFIVVDNTITIFEINPRPGGSLITNQKYFNLFMDKLTQTIQSI